MRVMCALLGMAASVAFAGGYHPSQDQGQAQDQSQTQWTQQGQHQGQIVTMNGGPVSLSGGQMSFQSKTHVPYQAPSVYQGAPRSTAPMLKCIGFGASGAGADGAGGGTGAWCWIVRPVWFEQQADKYLSDGLWQEAANARCMEKIQYRPFGGKQKCIDRYVEVYSPPDPEVIPTSVCDKKVARCEAAVVK